MKTSEVIKRLIDINQRLFDAKLRLKKKRGLRPSERAMSEIALDDDMRAIGIAVSALQDKQ